MRTTIDRAGRLVIPRPIRRALGLEAGGEVEIELSGAAILIEPVAGGDLIREADLLVIPGLALDDEDVRVLRDADRR